MEACADLGGPSRLGAFRRSLLRRAFRRSLLSRAFRRSLRCALRRSLRKKASAGTRIVRNGARARVIQFCCSFFKIREHGERERELYEELSATANVGCETNRQRRSGPAAAAAASTAEGATSLREGSVCPALEEHMQGVRGRGYRSAICPHQRIRSTCRECRAGASARTTSAKGQRTTCKEFLGGNGKGSICRCAACT